MYTDQHVKVNLWMRRGSAIRSTEKFHEAERAEIVVRGSEDGRSYYDVTTTIDRSDMSADTFESLVRDVCRLCAASFVAGKRKRSAEISALLGNR